MPARSRRPWRSIAEKSIVNPNATLTAAPAAGAGAAKVGAGRSARGRRARRAAPAAAPAAVPDHAPARRREDLARGRGRQGHGRRGLLGGHVPLGRGGLLPRHPVLPRVQQAGVCVADAAEVRRGRHRRIGQGSGFVLGGRHLHGGRGGRRKDRVFDRSVTLQPGSYKGTFGLFAAEGQPPVSSGVGQLQARAEVDRLRRLAADPLQRPGAADQAPRSHGSVRLRRREADQGRAQGRPHVLEDGQPLVLLRGREPRPLPRPRPMRPSAPARPRRLPPMRPSPAS